MSEWTFDELTSDGKIKDTWGSNHGTIYGNPQIKGGDDCVYGKCYSFNGTSDYISLDNCNNLKLENKGTIIAWIYPTSLSETKVIYGSSGSADVDKTPYFNLSSGELHAILGNGTNRNSINSEYYPRLNTWSFVGVSWDGVSINTYYNGNVKSQNQTYPVKFTGSTYFIGRPALHFDDRNFSGLLDDVRVYNAALSTAQIKQNYIAGLDSMLSKGTLSKHEYNERLEALANVDF